MLLAEKAVDEEMDGENAEAETTISAIARAKAAPRAWHPNEPSMAILVPFIKGGQSAVLHP
jgi:hypothetical protein